MKQQDYIQYIEIDKNKTTKLVTISFAELQKYRNCIDWSYICSNITKETCTQEFYTKFFDKLFWNNTHFLNFVEDEDDLTKFSDKISASTLFKTKPNLSEDFCKKYTSRYRDDVESWGYRNVSVEMLKWNKNLTTDFMEEIFQDMCSMDDEYNHRKPYIAEAIVDGKQPITTSQYVKYIEGELDGAFSKFKKFAVLVNPRNNFSEKFIREHKRDFNQVSFLGTDQVKELLAFTENPISENALRIFKAKIDYVHLLNKLTRPELLDSMVKVCKKELFDVMIKKSGDLKNQNNLDYLKRIM